MEEAGETGELKPPGSGPQPAEIPEAELQTSSIEIYGDETGCARFPNSTNTAADTILMIQMPTEIARLCRTNKKHKVIFWFCFSFLPTPLFMS